MNNNHRITLSTNKNIIVEFTNDTINRSEYNVFQETSNLGILIKRGIIK